MEMHWTRVIYAMLTRLLAKASPTDAVLKDWIFKDPNSNWYEVTAGLRSTSKRSYLLCTRFQVAIAMTS